MYLGLIRFFKKKQHPNKLLFSLILRLNTFQDGDKQLNMQMIEFFVSCWLLMVIQFQNALFIMSHSQCQFRNLCQFVVFVLHVPINWMVSFLCHLEQDFMFILVNFLFPIFPHFMRVNAFAFIVPVSVLAV